MNSPCLKHPKDTCPPGEGLAYLLRDAGPFDLVIIMVGTNDIGCSMDTRISQASVTHLHNACHTLGIPTVNVAPPTVADDVSYNEIRTKARELRKRLAESMNRWASGCSNVLLSLDCETLVPKSIAQLWETDQIHLSINGSQQLGQQMASQLTVVLEKLSQHGELAHMSSARSLTTQASGASPLTSQRQMQPVVQAYSTPRSYPLAQPTLRR
jgi:lysophospholipase L1-like esterase